jgi:uncharacterized membrane protein
MLLHAFLSVIHVLAGAAWFGSMFYSLVVLHPRAHRYFPKETEFEAFIATVSQGAWWKVLLAMGLIAVTGALLVIVRWPHPPSPRWLLLVGAKAVLFVAALCLFVHTSWRLWPARLFASPDEVPRFQRAFHRVSLAMNSFAVLSIILGVLLHLG